MFILLLLEAMESSNFCLWRCYDSIFRLSLSGLGAKQVRCLAGIYSIIILLGLNIKSFAFLVAIGYLPA